MLNSKAGVRRFVQGPTRRPTPRRTQRCTQRCTERPVRGPSLRADRRRRRRPVWGALLTSIMTLFAAAPSSGQTEPADDPALSHLLGELQRLESLSGGVLGVAAVHLESGRAVYLHPDDPFPMASTYKVPIAVQLMSRVDRGEIALSDMVELEPEDLHPGSGTLTRLFDDPGVALSLHNLMELMLLISDNSATDLTLEAAGGPDAVNARMAELGVTGVRVDRPTHLLISDWVGIEGVREHGPLSQEAWQRMAAGVSEERRAEAARAFASDPRDTATPRGMVTLLRSLWAGEAVGPESTELLKDVLERVETGTGRIKGLLPPGTTVAHKTGTIGQTTNDVGVIYLPGGAGHVATVMFVKDSDRTIPERERAIAQASRAVYDFFLFNRME